MSTLTTSFSRHKVCPQAAASRAGHSGSRRLIAATNWAAIENGLGALARDLERVNARATHTDRSSKP
jgi:hypothetical protein